MDRETRVLIKELEKLAAIVGQRFIPDPEKIRNIRSNRDGGREHE